ncbi:HNH endonuclease [Microcoleus vaginatus]
MPKSLGGSDESENLALACHRCNERHYNFTKGIDPETQQEVSLFNPRQQHWSEH